MNVRQVLEQLKEGKITQEEAVLLLKDMKESVVKTTQYNNGVVLVEMADVQNKNMFSKELITGLIRTFEEINQNDSCKVVILAGSRNYFACGGNEEGLLELYNGTAKMTDFGVYELPLKCRVPVIAAMNGHAIGGGWCLGMFCDFVLLGSECSYTCNHMRYGFTPGDGATFIFKEKMDINVAQEILYTGKTYKGFQLAEKGVSLTIVSKKEVLTEAKALADEIAQAPLKSLILLKEHMTQEIREKLDQVVEKEWENQKKTLSNNPIVLKNILGAFDAKEPISQLVPLNSVKKGKPIFWIHGDEGELDSLYSIAKELEYPVYGLRIVKYIEHEPRFTNIQILACDYVEQIKKKQSKGPYRLGGYSIGGLIAYEIVRQLQMQGEEVDTLLLIQAPNAEKIMESRKSDYDFLLQGVNRTLIGRNQENQNELSQVLIKPDEATGEDSESYLARLIEIGKERGLSLSISEGELWDMFWQRFQIKKHLFEMILKLLPLPHPNMVNCYYCTSSTEEYYGALESYFMRDTPIQLGLMDADKYWNELMDKVVTKEIAATNQFTAMYEPQFREQLIQYCSEVYNSQKKE
ncbi:MAG TPA: hypothetical protein DCW90_11780 [Lachnospiraceae bacterium]|nr:polyketide synthase [uncultured Lachnoclostridium sp.]HAU86138.1 hypothetical protein [Lachnospiraceae bacterium]